MNSRIIDNSDQIDRKTSRSICDAVGERLQQDLRPESSHLSSHLQHLLDELRRQDAAGRSGPGWPRPSPSTPPDRCRNNCRSRIAGDQSCWTAYASSGLHHRGIADARGWFPFSCRIGRISPCGDATLLGSRLALSVSSTLDVAAGNKPKNLMSQGKARIGASYEFTAGLMMFSA